MLTSPSGKSYIGQTTMEFDERWGSHVRSARNGKKDFAIARAIRKYGADNFKTEVLLICNNKFLNDYERQFIAMYRTLSPNGYNMTEGGDSNVVFCEETRKKMSETQKIIQNTEEVKERKRRERQLAKKDQSLPTYVTEEWKTIKGEKTHIGYRVNKSPFTDKIKTFASTNIPLSENLRLAVEYRNMKEAISQSEEVEYKEVNLRNRRDPELPSNVFKVWGNRGDEIYLRGYGVQKSRFNENEKRFCTPDIPMEENLQLAIKFRDMKIKEYEMKKVQRLNDSGSTSDYIQD